MSRYPNLDLRQAYASVDPDASRIGFVQVMGVDVKEKTVDTVLVIFSKATEVTLNVDQIVKANPKVIKMLGPVRPQ